MPTRRRLLYCIESVRYAAPPFILYSFMQHQSDAAIPWFWRCTSAKRLHKCMLLLFINNVQSIMSDYHSCLQCIYAWKRYFDKNRADSKQAANGCSHVKKGTVVDSWDDRRFVRLLCCVEVVGELNLCHVTNIGNVRENESVHFS